MEQKKIFSILAVILIAIIGVIVYVVTSGTRGQSTTSDATKQKNVSTQSYRNQTYGFEFQYPKNYVITDDSETEIILAKEENGHWIYDIRIEKKSDDSTLNQIIEKRYPTSNKVVNEIKLDGKTAQQYSIRNYGDYGNAGVVLMLGDNILTIYGDDSTDQNKSDFEQFISTFKF